MRGFPALAFDEYQRRVFPARCRSGAGRAAARDVCGARPIAFLLTDGRAYRLTPGADAIAVEPGAEADRRGARPAHLVGLSCTPRLQRRDPRARVASSLANVNARRLRFRGGGGREPSGVTFRRWRYPVFSTPLVGSNSLTLFDGRWYARGS